MIEKLAEFIDDNTGNYLANVKHMQMPQIMKHHHLWKLNTNGSSFEEDSGG